MLGTIIGIISLRKYMILAQKNWGSRKQLIKPHLTSTTYLRLNIMNPRTHENYDSRLLSPFKQYGIISLHTLTTFLTVLAAQCVCHPCFHPLEGHQLSPTFKLLYSMCHLPRPKPRFSALSSTMWLKPCGLKRDISTSGQPNWMSNAEGAKANTWHFLHGLRQCL